MSTLKTAVGSLLITLGLLQVGFVAEPDYPIRPVPLTDVEVDDQFWSPRIKTNRDVTVAYDFRKCEETGRIDNFAGGDHRMLLSRIEIGTDRCPRFLL